MEIPTRRYAVYFAQLGNLVKIGCSSRVEARCLELKARLLGTYPGAFVMERMLHQKFAAHRHTGEWFVDCPEIREFIEREAQTPAAEAGQ